MSKFEISKNLIFSIFFANFLTSCCKNRPNLNKKFPEGRQVEAALGETGGLGFFCGQEQSLYGVNLPTSLESLNVDSYMTKVQPKRQQQQLIECVRWWVISGKRNGSEHINIRMGSQIYCALNENCIQIPIAHNFNSWFKFQYLAEYSHLQNFEYLLNFH